MGVPGSRNAAARTVQTRRVFCRNFMDSIFSRGMKTSTARVPNLRTKVNTRTPPMVMPSIQSSVPSTKPKAYPAAISRGSPGMTATKTCSTTMPRNASRPQIPWASTQARNCSGSETNWIRGFPANQKTRPDSRRNRATPQPAMYFLCLSVIKRLNQWNETILPEKPEKRKGEGINLSLRSAYDSNPAHGKTAHPPSNAYHTRYPRSQLRNGTLAAHAAIRLMLLGSPPDMVHGTALRETKSSTPLTWVRRSSTHPRSGIHPCYSGLQATRHRWLPD